MGIPYYFKHIVNRFPSLISEPKSTCSRLYIDFNCIIHQCAAELNQTSYNSIDTFHDDVIKSSIMYINKICDLCSPSSLLYIGVDGVCPRAKMNQQRKRRYMSIWEKKFIGKETLWDSNIVTPGTYFMEKMDNALSSYTIQRKDLKVICSPCSEMGEGEHKIVNHIRNNPTHNPSDIVIYGLDADLIVLSMILHVENQNNKIYLLRENSSFNKKSSTEYFCTLDIEKFVCGLDNSFCSGSGLSLIEKVFDISILTSLIGNDFLPPLTFLKIRSGGLYILEKTYLDTYNQCKETLITKNKDLNWNFVQLLFKNLSKIEDVKFKEVNESYYSQKPLSTKYDINTREYVLDNYVELNKFKPKIDTTQNGWHSKYNELLLCKNLDALNNVCSKYIDGIEWMTEYYLIGERAQYSNWYYPYLYSPTICDLSNYLTFNKSAKTFENKSLFDEFIYTPEMQLLMVLPPESIRSIVPKYEILLDDLEYGCADMYPIEFNILTYLKHYLWECLPVLPDISENQIRKYVVRFKSGDLKPID